ncbi:hypothetical protein D3C81_1874970 [compost metagenome]
MDDAGQAQPQEHCEFEGQQADGDFGSSLDTPQVQHHEYEEHRAGHDLPGMS